MEKTEKQGLLKRILEWIERKGNRIPQPTTLFVILAIVIVLSSELLFRLGVSVQINVFDSKVNELVLKEVAVKSLLSPDGVRFMFEKAVTNFTNFAPVGIVLVTLFGIAAADGTGLLNALVKKILLNTSEKFLIPVIIFMGVMSNVASDAGYILVLPLAGIIYKSLGKNPLIGIMAGFFGVSAGFSANLLIGSIDPLLGNLSSGGAHVLDPTYNVSPMANYYFMFISTFVLVFVGTIVNKRIVEPKLSANYTSDKEDHISEVTKLESRGLKFALIGFVLFLMFIGAFLLPENGILRNQETGSILENSPFINSIVIIIALLFFVVGVFYGIGAKTVKSDRDLLEKMIPTVNTMGDYLILTFVAAQFISYFAYTNLGTIFAVNGADLLKATGLTGIPLLVLFVLFSAFFNLFIGSAVTKWSIMASVFVPMFMLIGVKPELTQLAYRIGDSSTNIISPLMPFFGIVLSIIHKYEKEAGMGTVISIMIPYSLAALLVWTLVMVVWLMLGVPIGL